MPFCSRLHSLPSDSLPGRSLDSYAPQVLTYSPHSVGLPRTRLRAQTAAVPLQQQTPANFGNGTVLKSGLTRQECCIRSWTSDATPWRQIPLRLNGKSHVPRPETRCSRESESLSSYRGWVEFLRAAPPDMCADNLVAHITDHLSCRLDNAHHGALLLTCLPESRPHAAQKLDGTGPWMRKRFSRASG